MPDTQVALDTIYVIVHKTKKTAYVGRTSRTTEQRFAQHLADAANPFYEKRLSEALRHDRDGFEVIECERSETASEAEWMQRFIDDGYELLNERAGDRGVQKRRDTEREREVRQALEGRLIKSPDYDAWLRETMDAHNASIDWKTLLQL